MKDQKPYGTVEIRWREEIGEKPRVKNWKNMSRGPAAP